MESELLDALGGGRSTDIVPGSVDAREQRIAEEEELERRIAEESGPVTTRRPTPVECVELGLPLDKAQVMRPEDLTPEDAKFLVSKGVKLASIGYLYGYEGGKIYYFMQKHGIKKMPDVPEYPWSSVTVVKAPKEEPVQEEKLTAIEWLRKHGTLPDPSEIIKLTPSDFNKDDVTELLKVGATYSQLAAYYGMSSTGHLGYYLKRAGLVGLSGNKPFGKKEKTEKQEITEADKQDLFAEPEPPVSDAARQIVECGEIRIENREVPTPAPTIDLDAWELITGEARSGWPTGPILHINPRGDCAIVFTDYQPGDRIAFRVSPTGRMLAVIKAEDGRPLTLNKKTKRRLRFGCKKLANKLTEKGVLLPADYRLEWNENVGAYIGTLVEKDEGAA